MNKIEQSFLDRLDSEIRIKRVTSENISDYIEYVPLTTKTNVVYGAVDKDGIPRGAIAAFCDNGKIDIKSLYVCDEQRRSKIGSTLLCKIKDHAAENDINTISTEYLPDNEESRVIASFFRSNGFVINDAQELISFKIADVAENENFKKLNENRQDDFQYNRLNDVPAEILAKINDECARMGLSELAPENARGIMLNDLSLACIRDDCIKAFVVVTDLNGSLVISTAYAAPDAHSEIKTLISIMLRVVIEKYGRYEKMCVSKANERNWNFVSCFVGNDPQKIETVTTITAVYDISAGLEIFRSVKNSEAEIAADYSEATDILVPKIWRLTDILNDNNIECDMTMLDNGIPGMLVTSGDGTVLIRYITVDSSYSSFAVLAYTITEIQGISPASICDSFNATHFIATAIPNKNGNIVLRAALTEGVVPVEESAFISFIKAFLEEAKAFSIFAADKQSV